MALRYSRAVLRAGVATAFLTVVLDGPAALADHAKVLRATVTGPGVASSIVIEGADVYTLTISLGVVGVAGPASRPVIGPELAASARGDKMAVMSRTRRLIVVVVVAASVLATTGILVFLRAPDRSGWIQVGTLSQVRARGLEYFPGPNVFVVAPTTGRPYALSAVSPHLGENLLYCQTSGWFVSLAHGEQFDLRGQYELGPAPAGMDRVALQIAGDVIDVDPTRITPGLPRGASGTDPSPSGPFCQGHNIQVAPGVIRPSRSLEPAPTNA